MSVIVGALEGPLGRVGTARSEEDSFMIELMLTLLRNVLAVHDDPAAPAANFKVYYIAQ
jgi:Timeless protein